MASKSLTKGIALIDKYFAYGIVLVIIFVGLGGYWLFLGPQLQTVQRTGLFESKNKQDELAAKKLDLEKIKALASEYSALNLSELEKISKALPTHPRIPDIFAQFEVLAQKNQIIVSSLSVHEGTALPARQGEQQIDKAVLNRIGVLDITLKVGALDSYEKLKAFLNSIESNMRLVDLTSLQYLGQNDHDTYSLNLKSYYLKSEK